MSREEERRKVKSVFTVVCGGSGSGKSEYAENIITTYKKENPENKLMYIATMMGDDEETKRKIQRHRTMRKDKGFETIECFFGLKHIWLEEDGIVLLDCLSNLVSNECFGKGGAGDRAVEEILQGVKLLKERSKHLVIVTNDVFSDGIAYDDYTKWFMKVMGKLNCDIAELADELVEVVYGIAVYHKKAVTGNS